MHRKLIFILLFFSMIGIVTAAPTVEWNGTSNYAHISGQNFTNTNVTLNSDSAYFLNSTKTSLLESTTAVSSFPVNISIYKNHSIELWFKWNGTQGQSDALFTSVYDTNSRMTCHVTNTTATNAILSCRIGNSTTNFDGASGNITRNTWTHLVVTQNTNGMNVTVYLNTIAQTGTLSTAVGTTSFTKIRFGVIGSAASFYDGWVDKVSVWNHTLNITEIQDRYNEGRETAPTDCITPVDTHTLSVTGNYSLCPNTVWTQDDVADNGVIRITASNVQLNMSNSTINGTDTGGSIGIRIDGENATVYNGYITNYAYMVRSHKNGTRLDNIKGGSCATYGVWFSVGTTDFRINNSEVYECYNGVVVYGFNGFIENMYLHNNAHSFIDLHRDESLQPGNNTHAGNLTVRNILMENKAVGDESPMFYVVQSSNIYVENLTCRNSSSGSWSGTDNSGCVRVVDTNFSQNITFKDIRIDDVAGYCMTINSNKTNLININASDCVNPGISLRSAINNGVSESIFNAIGHINLTNVTIDNVTLPIKNNLASGQDWHVGLYGLINNLTFNSLTATIPSEMSLYIKR